MNMALSFYFRLLHGLVSILDCFPPKRLDAEEAPLRKGLCEPFDGEGKECIWVHGASLCEVISMRPFLLELAERYGSDRVLATATSMEGLERLRTEGVAGRISLLPIDAPNFLEPFIERMKPSLVLFSETEIWPGLFSILARKKITYGMVNARITPPTIRTLRFFESLFYPGLRGLRFIFPQTSENARLFSRLHYSPGNWNGPPLMKVLGSFRYDLLPKPPNREHLRELFGFPSEKRVICFGATHEGEEKIILEAMKPLWPTFNGKVVLAPHQVQRLPSIEALLQEEKLEYSKLTHRRHPARSVLLVDTPGDLANLISSSSLAFVGGTLVPRGGFNLMTTVALGIPAISGPHLKNCAGDAQLLKNVRGLREVKDAGSLRGAIQEFLHDPGEFREQARRALQVLRTLTGSVERTMSALEELQVLPTK